MANNGLSGHVAVTSALHLTADIRAPMSVFTPISSASPPGADFPGGVAEGPFLTLSRPASDEVYRHWRTPEVRPSETSTCLSVSYTQGLRVARRAYDAFCRKAQGDLGADAEFTLQIQGTATFQPARPLSHRFLLLLGDERSYGGAVCRVRV